MHFWWWWFLVFGTLAWKTNWSSLRCLHIHSGSKLTPNIYIYIYIYMSIGWDLSVWWRVFSWMQIGGNWHGQCSVSNWTHSCVFGQFFMLEQVTAYLIPHPYHQELSLDSLPWISLEKAHLPWAQVYALDTPLKQPHPYLLTLIILLSSFNSNRDKINLYCSWIMSSGFLVSLRSQPWFKCWKSNDKGH